MKSPSFNHCPSEHVQPETPNTLILKENYKTLKSCRQTNPGPTGLVAAIQLQTPSRRTRNNRTELPCFRPAMTMTALSPCVTTCMTSPENLSAASPRNPPIFPARRRIPFLSITEINAEGSTTRISPPGNAVETGVMPLSAIPACVGQSTIPFFCPKSGRYHRFSSHGQPKYAPLTVQR